MMGFIRFVLAPALLTAVIAFNLAIGAWGVGAIGGVVLVYYLTTIFAEYRGPSERWRDRPWRKRLVDALTVRSYLGRALLVVAVGIVVAAAAFGFTIGVLVAAAIWVVLLGLWLAANVRELRGGRE
jgi:hypothetical protein